MAVETTLVLVKPDGVQRRLAGEIVGRRRGADVRSSSAGKAGGISVAQYGQTCQSDSSGCPHVGHADFSRVVHTGQTRYEASTRARQTGQR